MKPLSLERQTRDGVTIPEQSRQLSLRERPAQPPADPSLEPPGASAA